MTPSPQSAEAQEREAFEATARTWGFDLSRSANGHYYFDNTHAAWGLWQSARATLPGAAASGEAVDARPLTPFDAVERALSLASRMGASIGMSDVGTTEAYRQQLRAHLVEYIYPAATPAPSGEASAVQEAEHYRMLFNATKLGHEQAFAECQSLSGLLRRALGQLGKWQRKYGEHSPAWLPPDGDVRLAEDIDAALGNSPAPTPAVEGLTDEQIIACLDEREPIRQHHGAAVYEYRLFALIDFARRVLARATTPAAAAVQACRALLDYDTKTDEDGNKIELAYEKAVSLARAALAPSPVPMASSAGDLLALARKCGAYHAETINPGTAIVFLPDQLAAFATAASLREQEDEKALRDGLERQEMLASLLKVLQEDAARLDWLDEKNKRFRMGWKVGMAPAGNVSVQSVIFAAKAMTPTPIREAIDAQRSGRGEGDKP